MKILEVCFIGQLENEEFSFDNVAKNLKMVILHYKIGNIDSKTTENGNFKHVFLRTIILHLQTC